MNKESLAIRVQCNFGENGEELPRRFYLGDKPVEITRVIDRWLAPDHQYYKVRVENHAIYILRHDVNTGRWEITLYDSGNIEETRLSAS